MGSSSARIVVHEFRATDGSRAERWLELGRELRRGSAVAEVGAPHAADREDGTPPRRPERGPRFAWQLAAANHRTLARSAQLHPDRAAVAAEAARVVAAADGALRLHLVTRRHPGVYGWSASLDGVPVITCAHWFDSERTRRESLQLALTGLTGLRVTGLRLDGIADPSPSLTGG